MKTKQTFKEFSSDVINTIKKTASDYGVSARNISRPGLEGSTKNEKLAIEMLVTRLCSKYPVWKVAKALASNVETINRHKNKHEKS